MNVTRSPRQGTCSLKPLSGQGGTSFTGVDMLTITYPSITREQVWEAFRGTHDVRLRERHHGILLVFDGKSRPEIAPWLYRD
jgi:hypothetical protein